MNNTKKKNKKQKTPLSVSGAMSISFRVLNRWKDKANLGRIYTKGNEEEVC